MDISHVEELIELQQQIPKEIEEILKMQQENIKQKTEAELKSHIIKTQVKDELFKRLDSDEEFRKKHSNEEKRKFALSKMLDENEIYQVALKELKEANIYICNNDIQLRVLDMKRKCSRTAADLLISFKNDLFEGRR